MKELWINGSGRYINKGELFNELEECLYELDINVTSIEIYANELHACDIYAYKGGWNISNKELPKHFALVNYNSREDIATVECGIWMNDKSAWRK